MAEPPLLEVEDLSAGYGRVQVLFDLSIETREGEIVAVLGSNGAGKSTLINNITGIYRPFSGRVGFAGQDVTGLPAHRCVAAGLVQVPEARRIFPNLTVRENLELGSYRRGRDKRDDNLERVNHIFPRLAERVDQLAGTLSGGEQQMLAIGRGLMTEPRLLILDEPSLGLSPLLVEEMFALIERLKHDGLTILLVEQNLVQSLTIADRAYVIENGGVTLSGTAAALIENPEVKRSYLGI